MTETAVDARLAGLIPDLTAREDTVAGGIEGARTRASATVK
jgi:hypothetical protein